MLQLPYVQNRLMAQLLQYLSRTTEFSTTHQDFRLKWLHQATLKGLTISDPQGRPMLVVDELALQISPLQLLLQRTITLPKIHIQQAQFHLHKAPGEPYNFDRWLQRLVGEQAEAPSQTIPPWVLQRVVVQDLTFSIDDQEAPPAQAGFDWQHLVLHHVHTELADVKIQDNKVTGNIRRLTGQHAALPLALTHLSASLAIAPGSIQCQALNCQTGDSTLQGSCTVTYDPEATLETWIDQAHITAQLAPSLVAAQELVHFIPYFKNHQATYELKGQVVGKLHDVYLKDFQLDVGERNHLHGHGRVQGLPNLEKTTFDIELKHSILYAEDMRPYLEETERQLAEPFTFVKAQGHFYGTLDDFIAQATFDTDLGTVTTDLDFTIDSAAEYTTYKGKIATKDLALGALLQNQAVQTLSMQGTIHGTGLHPATAQFQLEADVDQLGLNGYNYQQIYTKGHFSREFFQGKLTIDDPCLKLQVDATIDLKKEHITAQGALEHASLQPLHLTDRPAILSTYVSVAAQGLSLERIQAEIQLQQLHLILQKEPLQLDKLQIHMSRTSLDNRTFSLDSELCAVEIKGNFAYPTLAADLQHFVQAYWRRWTHKAPVPHTPRPCTVAYQVYCKDINPLLRIVAPNVYLAPNTTLQGSFVQQETAQLVMKLAKLEALAFGENQWNDIGFELTARQAPDGRWLTATAQLTSELQQWRTGRETANFLVAFDWENDRIDFSHTWGHTSQRHHINLKGQALILHHTTEVTLLRSSTFEIAGALWNLHAENCIVLGPSWVKFKKMHFEKDAQKVSLLGTLSDDPNTKLRLKVENVAANNFSTLLNQKITGLINASVVLYGTLGQPLIDSDLGLQDLVVNDLPVGHFKAQTQWNDARRRLHLALQVVQAEQEIVTAKGFYAPLQKDQSLQLNLQLTHTPLAIIAPFVQGQLSQLAGELNSTLSIQGNPLQPQFQGHINIQDAAVKIDYLNTYYQFEGALTCTAQEIYLTALNLTDDQQGKAQFARLYGRCISRLLSKGTVAITSPTLSSSFANACDNNLK